jgi:5-methylcytosine-specific restriction endonuclease McrA
LAFDEVRRREIFRKTAGRCHICTKSLCFNNHGRAGLRGAWHVEHSIPRARGGTEHLNNLFAACIGCNLEKSDYSTRTARRWNGRTKAPLSKEKQAKARNGNAIAGAGLGAVVGGIVGGPPGAFFGSIIGGLFGHSADPEN